MTGASWKFGCQYTEEVGREASRDSRIVREAMPVQVSSRSAREPGNNTLGMLKLRTMVAGASKACGLVPCQWRGQCRLAGSSGTVHRLHNITVGMHISLRLSAVGAAPAWARSRSTNAFSARAARPAVAHRSPRLPFWADRASAAVV